MNNTQLISFKIKTRINYKEFYVLYTFLNHSEVEEVLGMLEEE